MARREVDRDRAEVLDDREIRVGERGFDIGLKRGSGRADLETGNDAVDGTFTCHSDDVEPELLQNLGPPQRHDRHSVGEPEAKRDNGTRRHGSALLEGHWVDDGYAAPNSDVYPWLWLWDSCFHSIIWAELGDDRAVIELDSVLAAQDASGFVPHMNYRRNPEQSLDLWGRRGASSITQPPMYGHAIAELVARGFPVRDETIDRAHRGLAFLMRERQRSESGLIELVHPWESGADDSPRWDSMLGEQWTIDAWRAHKAHLVTTVEANADGSPIRNPDFRVASVGFNALVAYNIAELETVTGASDLHDAGAELSAALSTRWDAETVTWVDDVGRGAATSASARTLDALLPALVDPDPAHVGSVAAIVMDATAFGGAFGPAAVHRDEPTFDPDTYWRGPAWPQLSYLMAIAMRRAGHDAVATQIADATVAGATASGFAEYWNPDTGAGRGAIPQSWAGLAAVL